MDRTWCLMAVLMKFFVCIPILYADCPYKECVCSETWIFCQSNDLMSMPEIVGTNVTGYTFLNLNNNSITTLPSINLPPGLQDIDLQNNPIASIDDAAFEGSTKTLLGLELSHTALTKIPNSFGTLNVLTSFHLSDSNITDWNEEIMKNIGRTLTNLELINVGLNTWPKWLQFFPYISDLTIADSYISYIPDSGFDIMINNLTTLSLYGNRLTMIPKAIYKLQNLQNFIMYQNKISDVSWLPQTSSLISLYLSDNQISDSEMLTKVLQPYANSLLYLALDKNLLTTIPDFSFLSQIDDLDLTYNRISDPFSGSAQVNLATLNLSHNSLQAVPTIYGRLVSAGDISLSWNSISVIQATDFHPITTYVDLGHNLITELTDSSFPVNSSIMFLFLNDNPLTSISDGALRNLPNLVELNLENTNITRLPLGLSSLTKLGKLDVSNIAGLVCTCHEKDLIAWMKTITISDHVIGKCGKTSVYNFFTNINSSCP